MRPCPFENFETAATTLMHILAIWGGPTAFTLATIIHHFSTV